MTLTRFVATAPGEVLDALLRCGEMSERKDFHPEPHVLAHIHIVFDRLAQTGDVDLMLAAVFHDITKPDHAVFNEEKGFMQCPGHDKTGAEFASRHADFITAMGGDTATVVGICAQHMRIHELDKMRPAKRLKMTQEPFFEKLVIFSHADDMLTEFTL